MHKRMATQGLNGITRLFSGGGTVRASSRGSSRHLGEGKKFLFIKNSFRLLLQIHSFDE